MSLKFDGIICYRFHKLGLSMFLLTVARRQFKRRLLLSSDLCRIIVTAAKLQKAVTGTVALNYSIYTYYELLGSNNYL